MGDRRAPLVSGLVFVAGVLVLGGAFLAARATAASLGLALALLVPAGAVAVLVGALGLVLGMVAYIVDRRRADESECVEKEDGP